MSKDERMDLLSEVRFWQQVIGDAKRTVLCSPEMESRCKGYVDARGLGGLITVKASRAVPDDRLYVIDEQAVGRVPGGGLIGLA